MLFEIYRIIEVRTAAFEYMRNSIFECLVEQNRAFRNIYTDSIGIKTITQTINDLHSTC